MDNKSSIDFLYGHKNKILEQWSASMDKEYPGLYDLIEMQRQGHLYLDLIFDTQIPVHAHPLYNNLPEWCKLIAEKNTPIVHTLHSSHIMRETILDIVSLYDRDHAVPGCLLSDIRARIDSFERGVIHFYWDYARAK